MLISECFQGPVCPLKDVGSIFQLNASLKLHMFHCLFIRGGRKLSVEKAWHFLALLLMYVFNVDTPTN